jgi:hypothetical protein
MSLLSELTSPHLRRLYQYWEDRRGKRWAPRRCDIDPVDFAYALSHVLLVDVDASCDPVQFRYRVHGSALATILGKNMTGRTVADWPQPEHQEMVQISYMDVVLSKLPQRRFRDRLIDGRHRRFEALFLPLSEDGETVSMILGTIQPYGVPGDPPP